MAKLFWHSGLHLNVLHLEIVLIFFIIVVH